MADAVLSIQDLPDSPLDAASYFYGTILPGIRIDFAALEAANLVIIFEPAGHEHRAWRLAAVQELAREYAPTRVNGLIGIEEPAIERALSYLEMAEGVTGQLLSLDGQGAGNGLSGAE